MPESNTTPLAGRRVAVGGITLSEAPATGLVTYRGDLADPALGTALRDLMGTGLPARGTFTTGAGGHVGWMSPDELLLMPPRDRAADVAQGLGRAMAGRHHLALDLSDGRALIRLQGQGLRDILAKITPADLRPEVLPVGSLRRTRLGQVAGALAVMAEDEVWALCFRSVGVYLFELLAQSARDGRVGHFA